jgi:hypothetical protein
VGFRTDETNLTLRLFGDVHVPFSRVRIGALYVGTPTTNLNSGLIRGFLSQEDADAIVVTIPTIGDRVLSSILPNLSSNCATTHTDEDSIRTSEGCLVDPGWWFYLNFSATIVPYDETPTSVEPIESQGLLLDDAVPNPFNPSAALRFSLPSEGLARVSIYDATGAFVADLVHETLPAGEHTARWDGTNAAGVPASSGVYFVRLESAGQLRTRKIVLLK